MSQNDLVLFHSAQWSCEIGFKDCGTAEEKMAFMENLTNDVYVLDSKRKRDDDNDM